MCSEERAEQEVTYSGTIFTHEAPEGLGGGGTEGKWREKQKGLIPEAGE